ncbi:MAG: LapA family protein [Woeseiaceae bacterium]|jgi:uncharacterized membrane protein YciS (DUF1049 family)
MLKRIALIIVVIAVAAVVFVFTSLNTGMVDVNLAFDTVTTTVPFALTATFILGWLFGVLCMGYFALKLVNERRQLKRALRLSQTEVSSLRSLPLSDAD